MKRISVLTGACALLALALTGCPGGGSGVSFFYKQKKPQAIRRDTVTSTGAITSVIQNPQDTVNGVVKITPVESLGLQPVALAVDAAQAEANSTFKTPRTLMLPPGFTATLYAVRLGRPRDLILREDGTIFYSDNDGRIMALSPDKTLSVIASELKNPHGMDMYKNSLFYTDETHVYRFDFTSPTAVTGTSVMISNKVPEGGVNYTRTIRWVPADKKFYISIGSTRNNDVEAFNQYAAVVRMDERGGNFDVVMRGLRNAVGLDVHPETGELWATETGTTDLGADIPPDEINIMRVGRHYGWPYYYGDNFLDPDYKEDSFTSRTEKPIVQLQAHSNPTDMQFYSGTALGPDWKNAMLVVQYGPRTGDPTVGCKVVRVRAGSDGSNPRQADFIAGFVSEKKAWGHPTGIAISPGGTTFYVSDEYNGAIYKISKP